MNTDADERRAGHEALAVVLGAVLGVASAGVFGQERDRALQASVIPLEDWSYQELYQGMTAKDLMAAQVDGSRDRRIGTVDNLLLDRRGRLVGVIARIGGFWMFGGTHLAIPWNRVDLARRGRGWAMRVPVTKQDAKQFRPLKDDYLGESDIGKISAVDPKVATGARIWKATDLLGDYVIMQQGQSFGYVADLILSRAGQLRSVVANATNNDVVGLGYYAYPWYSGQNGSGYAWEPDMNYYVLPYDLQEIAGLSVFDYDKMDRNWYPRH